MSTKKRTPLGSTMEEFAFGTKEAALLPTAPEVVLPAPTPSQTSPTPPTPEAALPIATPPQPEASAPEPVPAHPKRVV